jgi:predicted RNA-binding protein YlqC (UPF0109 family)
MTPSAAEVLECIIKGIVKYPEVVTITQTTNEEGVSLMIKTDPSDMGIIIGKGGQMIDRIRVIVRSVGMKSRQYINIELDDPRKKQL